MDQQKLRKKTERMFVVRFLFGLEDVNGSFLIGFFLGVPFFGVAVMVNRKGKALRIKQDQERTEAKKSKHPKKENIQTEATCHIDFKYLLPKITNPAQKVHKQVPLLKIARP